ncbi:MAG: YmfL family putative regulatory protein [Providencia sp.]|uniref:YmfL family putative regulatory protein n=1 Tax=Providencia sp. TaxID=589 RepID=UPI003F964368
MAQHWKTEKQPAWLITAIRKTIADLPGGYSEAAEILQVTDNSLFNRLRSDGDQVFPMGWAMVLQKASGTTYIADAISSNTDGGIHIPGAAPNEENIEISESLSSLVGDLGNFVNAYRDYASDDEFTVEEWETLKGMAYKYQVTIISFLMLVGKVYCDPKIIEASDMRSEASSAKTVSVE